jgi:glycosidase
MKKLSFLTTILFVIVSAGYSQVITVTPPLPTDESSVELIFDATLGNAGLATYTGDVYAHAGVITNLSTSSSDWKYVKAGWAENIPACKLSPLGNNKYKLIIEPSIRSFYKVPAGEVIQKLAFVFRSADGTKTGKTDTGGDIFYDVYPSSLSVSITNPTENFIFVDLNQSIPVSVSSLFADSTLLYVNGLKVAATNTNQITTSVTATDYGQYIVKAIAKTATAMVADSFIYYVRPAVPTADLPAGMKDGINYLSETSVLLCLYAPNKSFAYAIGDFNNWIPDQSSYMNRTTDGKRYWIQLNGLVSGKEYIFQYLVDNNIRIGDPYANKVSDPWNDQYISSETYPGLIPYPAGKTSGIATVFQTAQKPYTWNTTTFTPPAKTDLVIYELLVRDFTDKHTFQSVIDTIGYLHKLGINAIELMPVNEFEGNLSWGYNPNYYFAVDKYYGPATTLKQLVDTCHQLGIAVIGDLVLNHSYGTSPLVMLYWDGSKPTADNPWYNVTSPNTSYSWGYDFNHESADTKKLVDSVTSYWMNEFHLDGFRFDFTKGFTNTVGDGWAYDASRIAILERMATEMWKRNPNAYVIFEHLSDNSEEKALANFGIMLWGNMNYNYNEAAKGVIANSNVGQASYAARGWTKPHLVAYMESHDEERQMFNCISDGRISGNYSVKDTATALKRAALTSTFFLTIPGPKMIWQFGERGYDYSINYNANGNPDRLASKPPRWDYMNKAERVKLYDEYSKLILLKKKNPIFKTTDFQLDVSGAVKKITLNSEGKTAIVLGNFDVVNGNVSAGFPHTGTWYDYISGDSLVLTNANINNNIIFKPGEYRIYLSEKFTESYGISENKKEPFSVIVSPNPVSELSAIEIKYNGTAFCEIRDFTLLGSESKTIYSGSINTRLLIPWKPVGNGIHILKVKIGNQQVTRKVVVQ